MICDSPEQLAFIQEAVRKYPCNYEQALQLANNYGLSIQNATIIPLDKQPKGQKPQIPQAPQARPQAPDTPPAAGANGHGKTKGKTRKATK